MTQEYRYMIYNNVQKCFQFPSICETTEKGANTMLFKQIGHDASKWRFEIRKVEKEKYIGKNEKYIAGMEDVVNMYEKYFEEELE